MNTYLHSLPFQKDKNLLSSCICPGQAWDPPSFKLYCEADRFPTFCLRLPIIGDNPDLTYANECLVLIKADGEDSGDHVASYTMNESGVTLSKDSASYYIVYDGRAIPGLKMDCDSSYRLLIADCYSEAFWITSTPTEKIRLEFSNKSQLGDVPYQQGFVQKILIDGEICSLSAELFENRKTETNGTETITYQKMTVRSGLQIFRAPDFIAELVSSARIHEGFKVVFRNNIIEPLRKQAEPTPTQNGCCDYDIDVILPTREIKIIGGNCQTDVDTDLTQVVIPADLPNSCEVDDDWTPTDTVICLKKGESPPVIDVPIVRVIPTPPNTCPPLNFVLGNQTFKVPCSTPWIKEGVHYQRKVIETRADGNCGTTQIELFYDPCAESSQDEGSVQAVNIECEGVQAYPTETTIKPAGLNRIAFTHDVDSHEFSMYVNAIGAASIRLVADVDPQPSGISSDGFVYDQTTFLPGTTVNGTTEFPRIFRFNPTTPGNGGVLRDKAYTAYVKLDSSPLQVFKFSFRTANVSTYFPPVDFPLSSAVLENCKKQPKLLSISGTQVKLSGQFDADELYRFFLSVLQGAITLFKVEMVYFPKATDSDKVENAKETKLVQFYSSASFDVALPGLTATSGLSVMIQSSSCKSNPSSLPLTIDVAPLAFETGYPRYTSVSGVNTGQIRLKTAGPQATKVKNVATNAILYDDVYNYAVGSSLVINNIPFATYLITVGSLSYTMQVLEPVSGGNVVAKVLSHSLPFHIDIEITGSDKRWIFKDKAGYQLPAGCKFLYKIAGDHFITDSEISGYVYNSNSPVRILKGIIKNGYVGLWQWADANGITINDDVSPGFSYNNSVAHTTIAFVGGSLDGFINVIPEWLDPSVGDVQFMDQASSFTLPYGHATVIQRGTYSIAQILAKGATHIPNGQQDWGNADYATVIPAQRAAGITYSDVPLNNITWSMPRNESIPETWVSNPPGQGWPYIYNLQVWPNGPLDEPTSRAKAHISPMNDHALHIGEAEENWPAISSHWPMWNWLYDESRIIRKSKWDDHGIASYMCHNYYHIGYPSMLSLGAISAADQKAAINRPIAQWTPCGFEPGGNLQWTDSVAHGIYLGAPDKPSVAYEVVFLTGAMRMLGKKSIVFAFLSHEWRPNNYYNVNYSDGTYYQQGKVPVDIADAFNLPYLVHVHGTLGAVSIEWGGAAKSSHRNIFAAYANSPLFFATGSTNPSAMPHYGQNGYAPYNGLADIFNIGTKSYADIWGTVDGGTEAYLDFRLDGGEWISASNIGLNDIIDAFNQKRGWVFSRRKGSVIVYYYLNPWGDGTEHAVEIKSPVNSSIIWTGKVSSSMALTQTKAI